MRAISLSCFYARDASGDGFAEYRQSGCNLLHTSRAILKRAPRFEGDELAFSLPGPRGSVALSPLLWASKASAFYGRHWAALCDMRSGGGGSAACATRPVATLSVEGSDSASA